MASEMQADVTAAKRALQTVIGASEEALMWVKQIDIDLNRRVPALPAQTLTEDQIVAALKADPAMAGRVMSKFASRTTKGDLDRCRDEARFSCEAGFPLHDGYAALQSLAVALAAASYRG